MNIFGFNLQKLRKEAKLTQRQLADKIGVKRCTVGAWEEGRSSPNTENLAAICEALDCWDATKLLRRQEIKTKVDSNARPS